MVLDYLKKARDWVVGKVDFILGPWMRNPELSMKLFHALAAYSLMLTVGGLSKTLLAKLVTWAVLFVWTVARSFKLSDVVHPLDAVKSKAPELAAYHVGAGVGFLVTSL